MSFNPIGILKKAFGIFKKQSAAAAPVKGADAPFEHDDNVVLVFGHSNAGKTVYFSVLYELLKGSAEYKLSPLNNETAAALIENFNLMRGKQLKIKDGRQIEVEGERKFPTMTSETRILKFALDMSIRKGIKFYTVDYKGESLSIAEPGGLRKQFAKFFPYARAALFFIDASVLDTDVLLREQIAAFQTIINDLRDCVSKKIPIGIVITKADFLDGFSPSNPVELIPANAAIHKGKGRDAFIRGLASINERRFGEVWAKSCEKVTRTLGNLIDSMTSYNVDFQFFFVTATGGLEKVQTGVQPPREITPSGVPDPLIWSFQRILFNKRRQFWWRMTKWVMALCFIYMTLFSAVNLYHYIFIFDGKLKVSEKKYMQYFAAGKMPIDQKTANLVKSNYDDYLSLFPVAEFFGAKPLMDFARERQRFTQSQVSADAVVAEDDVLEDSPFKEATEAATKDYNKLAADVAKLPPAEQQAALDAKMAEFWTKHPPETLDPAFVTRLEQGHEKFKSGGADVAEQKFELELTVQNIRDKAQVTIQIGSDTEVEFGNLTGGSSTVTNKVSGAGNEPITFKWLDYNDASAPPLQQVVENPIEEFYPKLNSGFRVDFQKDYNIIVKLKSGTPPKPPSLPQL
ncbi:MAG: hypothetical protein WBP29_13885 [Candidatus Zixiibacteriota bacterium]